MGVLEIADNMTFMSNLTSYSLPQNSSIILDATYISILVSLSKAGIIKSKYPFPLIAGFGTTKGRVFVNPLPENIHIILTDHFLET